MNGFLCTSTVTLDSASAVHLAPSTVASWETSSVASTVQPGIGSLSGKAALAVGNAALRRLETFEVQRRLLLATSKFPHNDNEVSDNIIKVYDDILELSRPSMYSAAVRAKAMKLLLTQIAHRQVDHLLLALMKWPSIEIALFLSEILASMPNEWIPPEVESTELRRHIMDTYLKALSQSKVKEHPSLPLVDFIGKLADTNFYSCRAIMEAGFLDMLVYMTLSGFQSSRTPLDDSRLVGGFLDSCEATLRCFFLHSECLQLIASHPIRSLWPSHQRIFKAELFPNPAQPRNELWRQLGNNVIMRRIRMLKSIADSPLIETRVACMDLVEFCREDLYGSVIKVNAWEVICIYLAQTVDSDGLTYRDAYYPSLKIVGFHELVPILARCASMRWQCDAWIFLVAFALVQKSLEEDLEPTYQPLVMELRSTNAHSGDMQMASFGHALRVETSRLLDWVHQFRRPDWKITPVGGTDWRRLKAMLKEVDHPQSEVFRECQELLEELLTVTWSALSIAMHSVVTQNGDADFWSYTTSLLLLIIASQT